MQIERRHSNKQKFFFGAVEFKLEPDMTVKIKNLAKKWTLGQSAALRKTAVVFAPVWYVLCNFSYKSQFSASHPVYHVSLGVD